MDRTLWIVAGLLAVAFLFSGIVKLVIPQEKLATFPAGGWVNDFSAGAVRAIGVVEILGGQRAWCCPLRLASPRYSCRWRPSGWPC